MPNTCKTCIYRSDGFGDDVRGAAYCYSSSDYVPDNHTCDYWQGSLRTEPLAPFPMTPEAMLAVAVGVMDTQEEN